MRGFGNIRVDDSIWRVTGEDMGAGAKVRVTGVEGGSLLRVSKAESVHSPPGRSPISTPSTPVVVINSADAAASSGLRTTLPSGVTIFRLRATRSTGGAGATGEATPTGLMEVIELIDDTDMTRSSGS